ncbi:uncharacterized protein [Lolium perenne]|uniref:uncharacterized protein n=1 Tax=Lolium perenne TaxID=4522 RepID=UPI0021F5D935|nr:uncharacterized protein LOC127331405 [Lolium perenne]
MGLDYKSYIRPCINCLNSPKTNKGIFDAEEDMPLPSKASGISAKSVPQQLTSSGNRRTEVATEDAAKQASSSPAMSTKAQRTKENLETRKPDAHQRKGASSTGKAPVTSKR